jgi:uncharacterized protein Veg
MAGEAHSAEIKLEEVSRTFGKKVKMKLDEGRKME